MSAIFRNSGQNRGWSLQDSTNCLLIKSLEGSLFQNTMKLQKTSLRPYGSPKQGGAANFLSFKSYILKREILGFLKCYFGQNNRLDEIYTILKF